MNIKKQQGMSMLGILMVVMLVVSAMLLAMQLVPVYIGDYAVAKAVAALDDDADLYSRGKKEIQSILTRRLVADKVDGLTNDSIQVEKNKGLITIDVNYEARVPLIRNLELIASFSHKLEKNK